MAKKTTKSQPQRSAAGGQEMVVFVSWSKDSKPVAELFCDWLPKVIQQVDVWQSEHIESGAKWFATLSERLSENDFGVLMVTKKNRNEPWLQFEAGALSKALHSKVTPVFCHLSSLDLVNTPLQHLQGVKADRKGFWKLVSDVNAARTNPLDPSILEESFQMRWPEFERAFNAIKFEGEAKGAAIKTVEERLARIEDVLEAILKSNNQTSQVLTSLLELALSQVRRGQIDELTRLREGLGTRLLGAFGPLATPPPGSGIEQLGLLGKAFESIDPKKPK